MPSRGQITPYIDESEYEHRRYKVNKKYFIKYGFTYTEAVDPNSADSFPRAEMWSPGSKGPPQGLREEIVL